MKVYRMQAQDGRGPFRPGLTQKWLKDRPDLGNLKTWMQEFSGVGFERKPGNFFGCACKTPKQLKRWFTRKEYKALVKLGYQAVEMEVSSIIGESLIQVIFLRDKPLNESVRKIKLYAF